jgi:hypothetical protein
LQSEEKQGSAPAATFRNELQENMEEIDTDREFPIKGESCSKRARSIFPFRAKIPAFVCSSQRENGEGRRAHREITVREGVPAADTFGRGEGGTRKKKRGKEKNVEGCSAPPVCK